MNQCMDCVYFRRNSEQADLPATCVAAELQPVGDGVEGGISIVYCWIARHYTQLCGQNARWFSPASDQPLKVSIPTYHGKLRVSDASVYET